MGYQELPPGSNILLNAATNATGENSKIEINENNY